MNNTKATFSADCDFTKSFLSGHEKEAAKSLAESIVQKCSWDEGIYTRGPALLLEAMILRVYYGDDFPVGQKNLKTVYDQLQTVSPDGLFEPLFRRPSLTGEAKACIGPYESFKQASPNLRANMVATLSVWLFELIHTA